MKTLAFVLFLAAATVQAAATAYGFDTSRLVPGIARVYTVDESVKVTIRRDGEIRHVTVERLGIRNEYRLEPVDGVLKVTKQDLQKGRPISPRRILVDGVALEGELPPALPGARKATYYICPKDQTMLRVPHSNHDGEFKCPVDGTPMKPGAGRTSPYFLLN